MSQQLQFFLELAHGCPQYTFPYLSKNRNRNLQRINSAAKRQVRQNLRSAPGIRRTTSVGSGSSAYPPRMSSAMSRAAGLQFLHGIN